MPYEKKTGGSREDGRTRHNRVGDPALNRGAAVVGDELALGRSVGGRRAEERRRRSRQLARGQLGLEVGETRARVLERLVARQARLPARPREPIWQHIVRAKARALAQRRVRTPASERGHPVRDECGTRPRACARSSMYLPETRKPWHPSYLSRHRSEEQLRSSAACSFVVVAAAPRRIFFPAPAGAGLSGANARASSVQSRFRHGAAAGIVDVREEYLRACVDSVFGEFHARSRLDLPFSLFFCFFTCTGCSARISR